jgi:hypothetical protein
MSPARAVTILRECDSRLRREPGCLHHDRLAGGILVERADSSYFAFEEKAMRSKFHSKSRCVLLLTFRRVRLTGLGPK